MSSNTDHKRGSGRSIAFPGSISTLVGLFALTFLSNCANKPSKYLEAPADCAKNPISHPAPIQQSRERAHHTSEPVSSPVATQAPEPEELQILEGSYRGIRIGMTEAQVRNKMEEENLPIASEVPYQKTGKLISLGELNFRFTGEGTLFQIYALNKDLPLEKNLKLSQSSPADFEKALGIPFEKTTDSLDRVRYRGKANELEILLIPMKDDPDVIFSTMITDENH